MHTVHCGCRLMGDVFPGGCLSRGCLPRGVCQGGSAQRGLPRGVSAQGGVYLPPWTEFLTYACENVTFKQLCLRTVKIKEQRISLWWLIESHLTFYEPSIISRRICKRCHLNLDATLKDLYKNYLHSVIHGIQGYKNRCIYSTYQCSYPGNMDLIDNHLCCHHSCSPSTLVNTDRCSH